MLGLTLALGACSAFDDKALKPLPLGGGASGGSGGAGGMTSGGRGGQSGGGSGGTGGTGGTGGVAANGGDASVQDDGGDQTRCGDGLVTGAEICDTGIAQDEPGACPTECPPLAECVMRALNGSGCQSECVVLQAQCEGGDDCCPGNCMPSNDSDCSSTCGDGIVQPDEGETCEPEPSGDAGDELRCSEDCDDDDACTMDVLGGSAMNCNASCSHVAITALAAGDGCCPEGANTLTDSDCMPVCGNNVRERGEDCDAPTGCNQDCDLGYSADQRRCLDTFAVTNEACAVCSCTSCTPTKLACFEDSDTERRDLCIDLQACVRASGCFDSYCFCGDAIGCFPPSGPCKVEVEAAAETTNAFDIDGRKMDTNYAIGRSFALDNCIVDQCESACE